MKTTRTLLAITAAALLLGACGASDPGPTESAQQREDRAASASIEGLFAFVRSLAGALSDGAAPRPIEGITPPTSETAEPQAL